MIEPRDEELARIYRDAEAPQPPQRVDDNIIAASRRVAGAKPRSARGARRWSAPVALAVTVVAASTLTLMEFYRQSDPDTSASATSSADRPSKPRSARQKAAAPAPATPAPQARRDAEEPRPDEGTASNERLATGQPGLAADVPRAPAAALSADANTLRESASTLQRAAAVGPTAGRVAASEARDRTPEKWLEDIRKLRTQARTAEAERELGEFRKRYPDYRLPEDLR
jgi:hypothetical protein